MAKNKSPVYAICGATVGALLAAGCQADLVAASRLIARNLSARTPASKLPGR